MKSCTVCVLNFCISYLLHTISCTWNSMHVFSSSDERERKMYSLNIGNSFVHGAFRLNYQCGRKKQIKSSQFPAPMKAKTQWLNCCIRSYEKVTNNLELFQMNYIAVICICAVVLYTECSSIVYAAKSIFNAFSANSLGFACGTESRVVTTTTSEQKQIDSSERSAAYERENGLAIKLMDVSRSAHWRACAQMIFRFLTLIRSSILSAHDHLIVRYKRCVYVWKRHESLSLRYEKTKHCERVL